MTLIVVALLVAAGGFVAAHRTGTLATVMRAALMHRGPYAGECPDIARLHDFVAAQGLRLRGHHHEIYQAAAEGRKDAVATFRLAVERGKERRHQRLRAGQRSSAVIRSSSPARRVR